MIFFNPVVMKEVKQYMDKTQSSAHKLFIDAHNKARETAMKRRSTPKKTGATGLSNTDTVGRAVRIRTKLYAKLDEIFASSLDNETKMALARDVMTQISKVDQKIAEINRREKALQAERNNSKNVSEQEKRRRKQDLEERRTTINRSYLYHADEGGMNPEDYNFSNAGAGVAAVSLGFSSAGISGTVATGAVSAAEVELSV